METGWFTCEFSQGGGAGHSSGGIYTTENSLVPLLLQRAMNLQNMNGRKPQFVLFYSIIMQQLFPILRPVRPTTYGSLLEFHRGPGAKSDTVSLLLKIFQ